MGMFGFFRKNKSLDKGLNINFYDEDFYFYPDKIGMSFQEEDFKISIYSLRKHRNIKYIKHYPFSIYFKNRKLYYQSINFLPDEDDDEDDYQPMPGNIYDIYDFYRNIEPDELNNLVKFYEKKEYFNQILTKENDSNCFIFLSSLVPVYRLEHSGVVEYKFMVNYPNESGFFILIYDGVKFSVSANSDFIFINSSKFNERKKRKRSRST